jgi:hypothetical protein
LQSPLGIKKAFLPGGPGRQRNQQAQLNRIKKSFQTYFGNIFEERGRQFAIKKLVSYF